MSTHKGPTTVRSWRIPSGLPTQHLVSARDGAEALFVAQQWLQPGDRVLLHIHGAKRPSPFSRDQAKPRSVRRSYRSARASASTSSARSTGSAAPRPPARHGRPTPDSPRRRLSNLNALEQDEASLRPGHSMEITFASSVPSQLTAITAILPPQMLDKCLRLLAGAW